MSPSNTFFVLLENSIQLSKLNVHSNSFVNSFLISQVRIISSFSKLCHYLIFNYFTYIIPYSSFAHMLISWAEVILYHLTHSTATAAQQAWDTFFSDWSVFHVKSPLDSKEIKLVKPKGNEPWIFIGRTDTEAEAPVLWPPDAKRQLIGNNSDARKDWGQKEKGATQDETVGWHHWLNGHEFEQI